MSNAEAAGSPFAQRFKARIKRMLGPRGVFLEGFAKHPVMVGSVIPSSRFTVAKMLDPVNWDECRLFVEYGPGVGTFCRPVLDRLRRDGTLIVIDTNPVYIEYLRNTITDGRFIAVQGSAADVGAIIGSHGFDHADYILSGLPFSTLPDGLGPRIAEETFRALRPGGAFLVYQFTSRARAFMARHFPRIDSGFEWRNIMPCFLYWGWKDASE